MFLNFTIFRGLLRCVCHWREGNCFPVFIGCRTTEKTYKHIMSIQPNPDISQYVCWYSASSSKQVARLQSERWQQHSSQRVIMSAFLITLEKSLERGLFVEWEPNWDQSRFLILGKWARAQGNIFFWLLKGVKSCEKKNLKMPWRAKKWIVSVQ